MQTGDIAHQIIEAVAGGPAGGVHVDAVEAGHDLGVIGNLVIRDHRLTEALDLDIGAVIRADGYGGVNDVRDQQHALIELILVFLFQLLQLLEALGILPDLLLDGLGLGGLGGILLRLSHQHADLLGELVSPGTQFAGLGDGRAGSGVEIDDLVHQRQFGILVLFPDVFADQLRVFPYEFDVQHVFSPLLSIRITVSVLSVVRSALRGLPRCRK